MPPWVQPVILFSTLRMNCPFSNSSSPVVTIQPLCQTLPIFQSGTKVIPQQKTKMKKRKKPNSLTGFLCQLKLLMFNFDTGLPGVDRLPTQRQTVPSAEQTAMLESFECVSVDFTETQRRRGGYGGLKKASWILFRQPIPTPCVDFNSQVPLVYVTH